MNNQIVIEEQKIINDPNYEKTQNKKIWDAKKEVNSIKKASSRGIKEQGPRKTAEIPERKRVEAPIG